MAAKSPAAKKAKPAKSVKTPKTAKSKTGLTRAQRNAYQAAFRNVVKMAARQQHLQAVSAHRAKVAQAHQRARARFAVRRIKGAIIRSTYLQARYGNQAAGAAPVPVRSSLRTPAAVSSYLETRYGKKTYALTKGAHSVRIKPRVKKGRVVSAGRTAVSKARTTRTATAAGRAAAARVPRSVQAASRPRKAAGVTSVVNSEWVTAGNDYGAENCVAVAVANHLLLHEDVRADDFLVDKLYLESDLTFEGTLALLFYHPGLWRPAVISGYTRFPPSAARPGMLIGFDSETGPHCGVLMPGGKVISWGEIVPLESAIEEAWDITWTMTS